MQSGIRVDDAGVGGGVTDLLSVMVMQKQLDALVEGLNFGGKGDRNYATNAGIWMGFIRQLMQEQRLGLPDDEELVQRLTTRTFTTNLAGKIVLEPKEHMRDRGVPSPDKADAVALAFAHESLVDWAAVYNLTTCVACSHRYVLRPPERPCPRCGTRQPTAATVAA